MQYLNVLPVSGVLHILLLTCLFATPGHAQLGTPPDEVIEDAEDTTARITSLQTGQVITPSRWYYNEINNTLFVRGEFDDIPFYMDVTNLQVLVNGFDIAAVAGSVFGVDPPVGLTSSGAFQVFFPMPPIITEFPLLDIAVELVYVPNEQAIARDRVSLYDLRFDQGVSFTTALDGPSVGLAYQLTGYGLGGDAVGDPVGIEELVLAEYPSPSLDAFNELLGNKAQVLPPKEQSDLRACIDYADLEEDNFRRAREFPAYRAAYNQAVGYFIAYTNCQSQGLPLCGQLCVQQQPRARDFELCVDTISGEPTDARVEDFADLELSFVNSQNPALIQADMEFEGYQALVDLKLSDMRVRWKESGCAFRPSAALNNVEINRRQWLREWVTCPATEINTVRALTMNPTAIPAQYAINQDPAEPRQLYITDNQLVEFAFTQVSHDAAKGTCQEDFIATEADHFLARFVTEALTPLADAVNDGQPETEMSKLLDQAFREMAIGLVEPDEYNLNARINGIATSVDNGLMLDWETFVLPLEVEDISRARPNYVSQGGFDPYLAEGSRDALGNIISSKFGMTTPWINEVLWARGSTAVMNKVLSFTAAELGIGGDNTVPITSFDAGVLASSHPVFGKLAGTDIEFLLERQLDALVFQPPDPSQLIPLVGWPMRYGANGMRLYIKQPDKLNGPGNVVRGEDLISVNLSFYEEEFSMVSSSRVQDDFLSPLLPRQVWQVDVIDMDILDCQKFSHYSPQNRFGSCEANLESVLYQLLEAKLVGVAVQLVDQIPAPQYFSLEGDSELELQTENKSRLHAYGAADVLDELLRP